MLGSAPRLVHTRIGAMALAGAGWWLVGVLLASVGPDSTTNVALLLQLLGLFTLSLSGVIYGIYWWADYLRSKFDW